MAKYKIIPSSRTIVQSPISIGHKAEKGVEAIEFDLTAWVETYGSGTLTVIMRRWGDAIPYPIALEIGEDNKATWVLSDIDTAKAGMAYAQLNYIVGDDVVKKSDIYTFRVMDSLTGEGDPPEAYESWLEHLTHFAAEAMAEVLDIEGIVTDKTLTVDGGIADAKKTGDEISTIKANLDALDPGLSQQAKAALLSCFRHVIWTDDNEDYYGILYNVLDSGADPTRPLTFNVPQVGPRTTDGFISLYGTPKVKRGAIVSTDTEIAHTIPYYNESQSAYDSESPYYPIPIPVGAQSYWMDGAIENHYAYSAHIVQWNSTTGRWDRKHPGAFIWTDALADSETPLSELIPYRQDISSFNDGTYYMLLGIEKCTGTRWSDTDSVKQTFPNGAYVAVEDSSGVVDASITNLALRFSF